MHCDILVGGTDKGYLRAFVEFLLCSQKNQFNITAVGSVEELRPYLTDGKFSLYLLEESLVQGFAEDEMPPADRCLILTEPMTTIDTGIWTPVMKYQKVSAIESIILDRIRRLSDIEKVHGVDCTTKLISCYCPSGGTGVSTIAQLLTVQKVSKGHKALLFSLDSFQSLDLYFRSFQQHNMSDYMVQMLGGNNWLMGLERMVALDEASGVHYLRAPNFEKDLCEFDDALWHQWLIYMYRFSDYDYIIVDLGRQSFDLLTAILEISDSRIYLVANDPVGIYKWHTFMSQVKSLKKGALFDACKVILRRQQPGIAALMDAYDGLLETDSDLVLRGKGDRMQLNLHSQTSRQLEVMLNGI